MISEQVTWRFRDSIAQFFANPKNLGAALLMGLAWGFFVIFISGTDNNPLGRFTGYVLSMFVLFIIIRLLVETIRFARMSAKQKTLHWEIDDHSLTCTNGMGQSGSTNWTEVSRVKRALSGFKVVRNSGSPLWISVDTFSPEQEELFLDIVKSKVST